MTISLRDTVAAMGNSIHIGEYIKYFEKQIGERNELSRPLSDCPNYFAWLNTSSEYVCYRIRELVYFNTNDHESFNQSYKSLLDTLPKFNIPDDAMKNICLFVKIRHLLVHKGFPTPHIAPTENGRPIANGVLYDKDEVWEICERLRDSKNFSSLKKEFSRAMTDLGALQVPFKHYFK